MRPSSSSLATTLVPVRTSSCPRQASNPTARRTARRSVKDRRCRTIGSLVLLDASACWRSHAAARPGAWRRVQRRRCGEAVRSEAGASARRRSRATQLGADASEKMHSGSDVLEIGVQILLVRSSAETEDLVRTLGPQLTGVDRLDLEHVPLSTRCRPCGGSPPQSAPGAAAVRGEVAVRRSCGCRR